MNDDKIPSIRELIKLAKDGLLPGELPKSDINENFDEAQRFVLAFNIKIGKHKVTPGLLYNAYCKWTIQKISKREFCMKFKLLFEQKRDSKNNYYLLNYKPMELVKVAEELRRKNGEE